MTVRVFLPQAAVFVPMFLCTSCTTLPDVRAQMLKESRLHDPDFPDGLRAKLTHFAYIGDVTSNGEKLRVVAARSIITGMLAPRGQAWLGFYDERARFVGEVPIDFRSPPLWCDGSRVYFFGLQTDGEHRGNALDLREGFEHRRYVLVPAEGSWTRSFDESTAD